MNERIRAIAEVEIVHRDAQGNVKSRELTKTPITYREGPGGQPVDIQED
jgi:hypothetical protein